MDLLRAACSIVSRIQSQVLRYVEDSNFREVFHVQYVVDLCLLASQNPSLAGEICTAHDAVEIALSTATLAVLKISGFDFTRSFSCHLRIINPPHLTGLAFQPKYLSSNSILVCRGKVAAVTVHKSGRVECDITVRRPGFAPIVVPILVDPCYLDKMPTSPFQFLGQWVEACGRILFEQSQPQKKSGKVFGSAPEESRHVLWCSGVRVGFEVSHEPETDEADADQIESTGALAEAAMGFAESVDSFFSETSASLDDFQLRVLLVLAFVSSRISADLPVQVPLFNCVVLSPASMEGFIRSMYRLRDEVYVHAPSRPLVPQLIESATSVRLVGRGYGEMQNSVGVVRGDQMGPAEDRFLYGLAKSHLPSFPLRLPPSCRAVYPHVARIPVQGAMIICCTNIHDPKSAAAAAISDICMTALNFKAGTDPLAGFSGTTFVASRRPVFDEDVLKLIRAFYFSVKRVRLTPTFDETAHTYIRTDVLPRLLSSLCRMSFASAYLCRRGRVSLFDALLAIRLSGVESMFQLKRDAGAFWPGGTVAAFASSVLAFTSQSQSADLSDAGSTASVSDVQPFDLFGE